MEVEAANGSGSGTGSPQQQENDMVAGTRLGVFKIVEDSDNSLWFKR